MTPEQHEKYSRQILYAPLGADGQERLLASSAVLVGCGALGTVIANLLVRAGVGKLRIVDRDFVEPSNLQRQLLFDEADARAALPKAVAAQRRLRAINSDVEVEGVVADLTPRNAEELFAGFVVILDGTDNFQTRLLMNDAAISMNVPWVYSAVVASYGVTMVIRPGVTACLACLLETAERGLAGLEETCDTVGVLNTAASVVASAATAEAVKLLAGKTGALHQRLLAFDVWSGRTQSVRVAPNPQCRACARREFTYLSGEAQPHITLCGRDSVQIHEHARRLNLEKLGSRLRASVRDLRHNDYLLRFRVPPVDGDRGEGFEVTVFGDGRAIVKGTRDAAVARSLYARYIGA